MTLASNQAYIVAMLAKLFVVVEHEPSIYCRYADDMFVVVEHEPSIYCCYADDMFVVIEHEPGIYCRSWRYVRCCRTWRKPEIPTRKNGILLSSKIYLWNCGINEKIFLLDFNIKTHNGQFISDVYRKTTNNWRYKLRKVSVLQDTNRVSLLRGGNRRAHKIWRHMLEAIVELTRHGGICWRQSSSSQDKFIAWNIREWIKNI